MNSNEQLKTIATTLVISILTTTIIGIGFLHWAKTNPDNFSRLFGVKVSQSTGTSNPSGFLYPQESIIVNTVKRSDPAVVAITVSKNVPVYERYFENTPSPFGDLFGGGGFYFNTPQVRQNGTEEREIGGGSGFLVSSDGYVVTNRHVVEDAEAEYAVFTNEGKKYDAKVIAKDPILDLAILKIDGSGFSYLSFGDSDDIQVGQSVIAIGNALAEFRNTVSMGIVSGLSRSIVASGSIGGAEALDQLIQTDAAINEGNSGGPLLNLSGDVVGVNVAVVSGAENIGFALSANSVKSVVESVQKTGRIVRPYLGVRYVPITEALKVKNQLSVDYGALVQRGETPAELAVIPGSPADKAGIVENDIILEVDGVSLDGGKDLAVHIRMKQVGDKVTLTLLHKGVKKTVSLVLEELKNME